MQGAIETDGKVSSTKGDLGVWKYRRSAAWIVNGKDGYQQVTTTGVVLKNNQADAGGAICLNNGSNGAIQDLSLIHISEPTRQAEISYAVFCLKKFFFNDTATTEIYTLHIVGSVRCV